MHNPVTRECGNGNDLSGMGSTGNAIVPKISHEIVFVQINYFITRLTLCVCQLICSVVHYNATEITYIAFYQSETRVFYSGRQFYWEWGGMERQQYLNWDSNGNGYRNNWEWE